MNKNEKAIFLETLLNKQRTIFRSNHKKGAIIEIRENSDRRELRDSSETAKHKIVTLRIQTDDPSPTYETYAGKKYNEIISSKAFDDSLNEVAKNKKVIYSFSDHSMNIPNIVSSTQRKGTKLFKDKNDNYIMEFELKEDNERNKNLIEVIRSGELGGNSFIFIPKVIKIDEKPDNQDIDFQVIHEEGELISIDMVVKGFYPQNTVELRSKDMTEEEKKALEAKKKAEAEAKLKAEEEQKAKDAAAEEKRKSDEAIAIAKKEIEEERKAKELEAQTKREEEKAELVKKAKAKLIADAEKAEKIKEEKLAQAKKMGYKVLSEKELRGFAMKEKYVIRDENGKEINIKDFKKAVIKNHQIDEKAVTTREFALIDKYVKRGFLDNKEDAEIVKTALNKRNIKEIDDSEISDGELEIFGLTRSGLAGNTNADGAAIIPVSTQNTVVGASPIKIPEFSGSKRIPMKGLEETKIPVDVDTGEIAVPIDELAESVKDTSTIVKVQIAPLRFSHLIEYNHLLQIHANAIGQKTINKQNAHKRGYLKIFYDGLFKHKASTYDAVKDTYTGGITKEAIVKSNNSGTIDAGDLQKVINDIIAVNGGIDEGQFKFLMKPETWGTIYEKEKDRNNAKLIRIVAGKTYFGPIEIVMRHQYTDEIAVGKLPVVLIKSNSVVIYGGITVVSNSKEVGFTRSALTRKVETRINVVYADPYFLTRAIEVTA